MRWCGLDLSRWQWHKTLWNQNSQKKLNYQQTPISKKEKQFLFFLTSYLWLLRGPPHSEVHQHCVISTGTHQHRGWHTISLLVVCIIYTIQHLIHQPWATGKAYWGQNTGRNTALDDLLNLLTSLNPWKEAFLSLTLQLFVIATMNIAFQNELIFLLHFCIHL